MADLKSSVLLLAALAAYSSAFPSLAGELYSRAAFNTSQDPNPYQAPGPTDYINRNGRNITAAQYQNGFLNAFGFDILITLAGATNTINLCSAQTGKTCTSFDLDILNTPHAIEHDGKYTSLPSSMSRQDFREIVENPADNHDFNMTVFQETLNIIAGNDYVTPRMSHTIQQRRFKQQMKQDVPGWFLAKTGTAITEQSFMLCALNNPAVGSIPKKPLARVEWIEYWFQNQRLPTDLGWVRPTVASSAFRSVSVAVGSAATIPASATNTPAATAHARRADAATPTATSGSALSKALALATSAAAAKATALAGPMPPALNAYESVLSPDDWTKYLGNVHRYGQKVRRLFAQELPGFLHGLHPAA